MKNIISVSVLSILFSCKSEIDQFEKITTQLTHSGFNVEAWKSDSLGCAQTYKIKQAYILRENKELFTGLNINKAVQLLGKPYFATETLHTVSYEYIAEGQDLCDQIKNGVRKLNDRTRLDVFKLEVSFNKSDSLIFNLDTVMP